MTDPYRPTTRHQRLVIVALTVATVVALWLVLLMRPGFHVEPLPGTPRAACSGSQTAGCVGGKAEVVLLPAPAAAASAAGPGAASAAARP
jgi:hypothetical protein